MSRKQHAEQQAQEELRDLKAQCRVALKQQTAFGTSKHEDAENGIDTYSKIYSHSTYENYLKESRLFVEWCSTERGCKTLDDCKDQRVHYIEREIERGMSASTVKKRAAALGKLYQDSILDKIPTPERHRSEITRSRDTVENDLRFRSAKHDEIKEFCRSTGLRRHEFAQLVPEKLCERPDGLWLTEIKGKGGKVRDVPVCGDEALVRRLMQNPKEHFKTLDTHMDIHSFRADYACRVYKLHARDLDELEPKQIYACRGDMAGRHFDREAMRLTSNALGHNRVEIVASNYLYNI